MAILAAAYLGDPKLTREAIHQHRMSRENGAKWNLIYLLVKLDIWPSIQYEGKIYPMNPTLPEFKEALRRRRHGLIP